jgi:hypothetical protein
MELTVFTAWLGAVGLGLAAIALRQGFLRWREARIASEWDPY